MEVAITVLALAEIAALFASTIALLVFATRKLVRGLRRLVRPGEDLAANGGGMSVNALLAHLNMQVSKEDARKIAEAVHAHVLDNKTMLTHAEFRDLARSVANRAAA